MTWQFRMAFISAITNFNNGEDTVGGGDLNTFDNSRSAIVDAEDYEPSITDSRPTIILTNILH